MFEILRSSDSWPDEESPDACQSARQQLPGGTAAQGGTIPSQLGRSREPAFSHDLIDDRCNYTRCLFYEQGLLVEILGQETVGIFAEMPAIPVGQDQSLDHRLHIDPEIIAYQTLILM